jgi:hypothetical protein
MKKNAVQFNAPSTTQQQGKKTQNSISCQNRPCNYVGPFNIPDNTQMPDGQESFYIQCPNCMNMVETESGNNSTDLKGRVNVTDPNKVQKPMPINPMASSNPDYDIMGRILNGAPAVDVNSLWSEAKGKKGPSTRTFNMHEPVCSEDGKGICPFTDDREDYKNEEKVIQNKAATEQMTVTAKTGNTLTPQEVAKLAQPGNTLISEKLREDLVKTARSVDVVIQPGSGPGCQRWCPKLRSAVAMNVCANHCIDGRRIPQVKGSETYRDYLVNGGDPNGFVACGYKQWLEREVDAYYPGWLEDHIKKMGGEVMRDTINRRMNLEDGERTHKPEYPREKLVEEQMRQEKRHWYASNSSNVKHAQFDEFRPDPHDEILPHSRMNDNEPHDCQLCKDEYGVIKPAKHLIELPHSKDLAGNYGKSWVCDECANDAGQLNSSYQQESFYSHSTASNFRKVIRTARSLRAFALEMGVAPETIESPNISAFIRVEQRNRAWLATYMSGDNMSELGEVGSDVSWAEDHPMDITNDIGSGGRAMWAAKDLLRRSGKEGARLELATENPTKGIKYYKVITEPEPMQMDPMEQPGVGMAGPTDQPPSVQSLYDDETQIVPRHPSMPSPEVEEQRRKKKSTLSLTPDQVQNFHGVDTVNLHRKSPDGAYMPQRGPNGLPLNQQFQRASAGTLPLSDGNFDQYFCFDCGNETGQRVPAVARVPNSNGNGSVCVCEKHKRLADEKANMHY